MAMKTPKKPIQKSKVRKVTKKLKMTESDSDSDSDISITEEKITKYSSSHFSDESIDDFEDYDSSPTLATPGSYVLCKFITDKNSVHYIGIVENKTQSTLSIYFLRRKFPFYIFYYPVVLDKYEVASEDIVMTIPHPKINAGTVRIAKTLRFAINLNSYASTLR